MEAGLSLVVQWLGLHAFTVESGRGLVRFQVWEIRSHKPT